MTDETYWPREKLTLRKITDYWGCTELRVEHPNTEANPAPTLAQTGYAVVAATFGAVLWKAFHEHIQQPCCKGHLCSEAHRLMSYLPDPPVVMA